MNRMSKHWAEAIVKVYIEIIDYGEKFDVFTRKDYRIMTVTDKGKIENIIGLFENKKKAKHRIREIAEIIATANNSPCKIGKEVTVFPDFNREKDRTLQERKALASKNLNIRRIERLRDNGILS